MKQSREREREREREKKERRKRGKERENIERGWEKMEMRFGNDAYCILG